MFFCAVHGPYCALCKYATSCFAHWAPGNCTFTAAWLTVDQKRLKACNGALRCVCRDCGDREDGAGWIPLGISASKAAVAAPLHALIAARSAGRCRPAFLLLQALKLSGAHLLLTAARARQGTANCLYWCSRCSDQGI